MKAQIKSRRKRRAVARLNPKSSYKRRNKGGHRRRSLEARLNPPKPCHSTTTSALCDHLLAKFGHRVRVEGRVITDKTSRIIPPGDEQFGLYLYPPLEQSISEAIGDYYREQGYNVVYHGGCPHMKKGRRTMMYAVVTENKYHAEVSLVHTS